MSLYFFLIQLRHQRLDRNVDRKCASLTKLCLPVHGHFAFQQWKNIMDQTLNQDKKAPQWTKPLFEVPKHKITDIKHKLIYNPHSHMHVWAVCEMQT